MMFTYRVGASGGCGDVTGVNDPNSPPQERGSSFGKYPLFIPLIVVITNFCGGFVFP